MCLLFASCVPIQCVLCQCASVSFRVSCFILYSVSFHLSFVTEKGSMVLFDCPISYILRLGWLQILAAVRDTPAVLELVSFFSVTPDGGWLICLDAHPWSAPRCSIRRLCTCSIHYAACIFFLYLVLESGGQGGRLKTPCIRPGGSRHLWEATGIQKLEYRQPVIRS